ncbi:Dabb family protein [Pedobacter duraquae]|uniref:Stress responsive alpha/beta barrel protein n=1 Tax=Pedobacter duraquae TaxID=425511 RepID=A0A4R6ILG2_9SPHI|nr:Dabb family protein [Pedobacter duraquae]TDO22933.1 stress responsive alpha/beta barrel protein [Pedobacter duraquae]
MNKSNRRKFIGTAAVLAAGTAASAMPLTSMENNYPIVHHVFFWLKNPDSKTDRDQLIAGVKTLAKIPTVRKVHVGIAASTEKRDVVDNSWAVSELMFFSDLEGQSTYQTHPLHLEFIKNHSHLWDKVVVYDVIEA